MVNKLPNLELVEYKVSQYLGKDEVFSKKLKKVREEKEHAHIDISFDVFLQVWGSTATGFEGIGGCAITEEYTVVAHERLTNTYVVCFGEKPCYMVTNPKKQFFEDLNKRNLMGITDARGVY